MMKHSLKKTLAAALLALVFLFDVLPMTARAEMSGELWVSGKKVTEKKLSGDGWRYEPKTNTLTLENYTYSGKGKKKTYGEAMWYSGLYYDGDEPLKIVLAGENRITVTDSEDGGVTCGILCVGHIEIGGEGSLAAIAGAAVDSYGVWCWTYTQKGGTVSLAADKAEVRSYGIYAEGDVSVSGGVLESAGAESGDWSCGIWCNRGFSLSGGNVKLTAGKAANCSYGLYNNSGDITFDGGSFSAVSGETYWNAGIYGMGDMLIHDGTVYASGADITNSNERNGAANGIITEGAITIDGGTVTAEAGNVVGNKDSQGMLGVRGLCINNGTVAAKAGNTNEGSYALASTGDIIINGGNVTAVSGDAVGGEECDSVGIFAAGENQETGDDRTEGQSSKIFINGGTVFAQGGSVAGTGDGSTGIYGYEITVMGGSVTAVGGQSDVDSYGIGVDDEGGVLIIGAQIQELTAVGAVRAVDGKIRTDVGGAGYTDAAGTEGKTPIPAGEEQAPDLLCVRFPD